MALDFLPTGMSLSEPEDTTKQVEICTDVNGVTFTVEVKKLSPSQFQAVARQLGQGVPKGVKPGSPAAERAETTIMRNLSRKIVVGWEGLTVDNFEECDASGRKVELGESADASVEIPFSHEAAAYLFVNSWGAKIVDPILEAVRTAAEKDEDEEGN